MGLSLKLRTLLNDNGVRQVSKDTKEQDRTQSLDSLAQAINNRSSKNYEFKRAVGPLAENLEYVSLSLRGDPQTWRLNRAFHIVHVPSLLAIMSMLENIDDMNSVSDEERYQINSSLHRAGQLAAGARQRLERSAFDEAKVELEVLAEYAPPNTKSFKKSSFLERTFDGVVSASESTLKAASSSAASLPGIVDKLKDGVTTSLDHASAVPVLASNLQRTLLGMVADNVSKPVAMRLQASRKALTYGVGAGVGIGVVTAILFPPLLPISAGGAVLAAMRGWRSELEASRKLNNAEREQRIAELKAERSAALLQLTNGASAFQMENEEISLTLDVETGEADAVILKGKHTGRTWSDLDIAEKTEVVSVFAQGAGILISILEFGTENL